MPLIEIFKAGKRRDANGVEVEITPAQLQQAVDNYDTAFHEAPVVIGHPRQNHPAYGWVKRLELDGDVLKAEFDQVDPDFAELVNQGKYKKVSASFYLPDSPSNPKQGVLSLRHVGFLGATPPAVKGLKAPIFSEENGEGILDFTEIAEKTPESLNLAINPTSSTGAPQMSETEIQNQDKQELARLKAENAQLKQEKAQVEAEKAKAEAEKAEAEKQRKVAELNTVKADNVAYAEKLVEQGKLAPVAKSEAIALLDHCALSACGEVLEFNEGESLLTLAKQFLEAQPQIIQFGEYATKARAAEGEPDAVQYSETDDPTRVALDRKARAYMKQHQCDYATAVNAVA